MNITMVGTGSFASNHNSACVLVDEKILVDINVGKGSNIDAYTYISTRKDGYFRPSDEYMNVIIEGAKLNGLSNDYLASLISQLYLKHQHQLD